MSQDSCKKFIEFIFMNLHKIWAYTDEKTLIIELTPGEVSISPIFYERLFCMEVFFCSLLKLKFCIVISWPKNIGAKAACKMLV